MTRLGSVQLPMEVAYNLRARRENMVLKSFEGLSFLTTEDLHLLTLFKRLVTE